MKQFFALAILLALVASHSDAAQPARKKKLPPVKLTSVELKTAEHVFKKTPQGELKLYFHFPPGWKAGDQRPAILFFFGGGWTSGDASQFFSQAEYFAARGMVAVRADYRIASIHHTTPDKCVEDAKSAMRWLRGRAGEFGVDPQKIISSGGSAGGHLAAAVALLDGFNSPEDNAKISCVPNAMVLFNPALNLTNIGDRTITNAAGENISKAISPTVFLKEGAPPSVIFFGTADKLKAHGDEYVAKAKVAGVRAEMFTAADQPHGFFNRSPWTEVTAAQADRFLSALGYLKGEPTIKLPAANATLARAE